MNLTQRTLASFSGAVLLFWSCASQPSVSYETMGKELIAMAEVDQRFNQMIVDRAPESREPDYEQRKQAMYDRNTARIQETFGQIGYPTQSVVGEEAANAFWLLTQHSDSTPAFQEQVLASMRGLAPEDRAHGEALAMLTDRVRINTGRMQVFGSQVLYERTTGKAMPKPLEAPGRVDQRRAEMGLEPLWCYINDICESHFTMNKQYYSDLGVHQAWSYPEGFLDW